ncbi:MAG TPA: ATP synthase subunit I [Oscillatoriales cyanobacterium M59_W2019_021]|nr:MAG: ATP synthase subunit I [Cyanobacteria bacterium J055]HIK30614.1 ATP synthase subunit I [Oscillatoriales cyanobacterium M4454_W2019_049]HIK52124.1 ATP synthase subunit I [Oscillatoriales cyanobacterium M59_W2019_021]
MLGDRNLDGEQSSIYPGFRRSESPNATSPESTPQPLAAVPATSNEVQSESSPADRETGMQEYARLKQELYGVTLALMGVIFVSVWVLYALPVALNYLLGATVGIVYLRMLARDVDRISQDFRSFSKTRFAVFIGAIVLATQVEQLQIVPIFLGFLTYKATLIVYMVRLSLLPERS